MIIENSVRYEIKCFFGCPLCSINIVGIQIWQDLQSSSEWKLLVQQHFFLLTSPFWLKNEQPIKQICPSAACMDRLYFPSIFKC